MRIGSIGYATNQGVAHLMRSFHAAGVITDVFVVEHPHYPNNLDWYPGAPRTPLRRINVSAIETWLKNIDVLLCFETPFRWELLPWCKQKKIKTVLVPMYEWYPEKPPHKFDRIICPSLLDCDYFDGPFLPIPVDPLTWQLRTKARRYLHNAGHIGSRNHKGTEELLRAMRYVDSPLELTIRCQNQGGMARLLKSVFGDRPVDQRIRFEHEVPYDRLFVDHDVYVAPEKYNGCSLPLSESRAAGLLVITTDRYPMNTWLPEEPLIPVSAYRRARVGSGYLEFDEAIVGPKEIAATMDEHFGMDISAYSESGRLWAEANSWEALKGKWLEAICG